MVADDQQYVHTSFVPSGSWSPYATLLRNQRLKTPPGGHGGSANPITSLDIRSSSSQFCKQHACHEKAVSRTSLIVAVEDVRRLSVFDHRCLRKIADIQWQHRVSNAEVRHRVFGRRDDNPIGVTILKHRLRWLGHALRMSSQSVPRRALLADTGTGWKKQRGGQCMTWCR
ncbi:unnamed protein product, partial [Schistosoma mattheei]